MDHPILDVVRDGLADSGNFVAAADAVVVRRSRFLIPARAAHGDLQAAVIDRWGDAFDLLELELLLVRGIMTENDEATPGDAESEGGVGILALHHLFWAGYVAACEVLVLFRQGFSGGALSRWRAVHEITTRAEFISRAGACFNETAESYLERTSGPAASCDYCEPG